MWKLLLLTEAMVILLSSMLTWPIVFVRSSGMLSRRGMHAFSQRCCSGKIGHVGSRPKFDCRAVFSTSLTVARGRGRPTGH